MKLIFWNFVILTFLNSGIRCGFFNDCKLGKMISDQWSKLWPKEINYYPFKPDDQNPNAFGAPLGTVQHMVVSIVVFARVLEFQFLPNPTEETEKSMLSIKNFKGKNSTKQVAPLKSKTYKKLMIICNELLDQYLIMKDEKKEFKYEENFCLNHLIDWLHHHMSLEKKGSDNSFNDKLKRLRSNIENLAYEKLNENIVSNFSNLNKLATLKDITSFEDLNNFISKEKELVEKIKKAVPITLADDELDFTRITQYSPLFFHSVMNAFSRALDERLQLFNHLPSSLIKASREFRNFFTFDPDLKIQTRDIQNPSNVLLIELSHQLFLEYKNHLKNLPNLTFFQKEFIFHCLNWVKFHLQIYFGSHRYFFDIKELYNDYKSKISLGDLLETKLYLNEYITSLIKSYTEPENVTTLRDLKNMNLELNEVLEYIVKLGYTFSSCKDYIEKKISERGQCIPLEDGYSANKAKIELLALGYKENEAKRILEAAKETVISRPPMLDPMFVFEFTFVHNISPDVVGYCQPSEHISSSIFEKVLSADKEEINFRDILGLGEGKNYFGTMCEIMAAGALKRFSNFDSRTIRNIYNESIQKLKINDNQKINSAVKALQNEVSAPETVLISLSNNQRAVPSLEEEKTKENVNFGNGNIQTSWSATLIRTILSIPPLPMLRDMIEPLL